MAEDEGKHSVRISRRDFTKLGVFTSGSLALANFLAGCRRAGIEPEKPTCKYDNGPRGWLEDAREYEVWKELVGEENPHAEEGFSLVFVGGIYFPPELADFRTTPSFQRHYEVTGLITSSDPNQPNNNVISRNSEAGGVLVINPVVVEGFTSAYEFSENSFFVPSPDGAVVENLKDIHHMWVAMATRPLKKAEVIGHSAMSRAELATGSAVTFANVNREPLVSLIPPAGERGGGSGNYDGRDGFWRYVKLFRQYSSLGTEIDWVESGKTAARWDGMAILSRSPAGLGQIRVGEIRVVKDEKDAREVMAKLENPLGA